ncbi:hypothetical protein N9O44_01980 [Gammaproteobacteria bacterium]|nr:hypothetical protein [Gammaproteobacteria bacterium]
MIENIYKLVIPVFLILYMLCNFFFILNFNINPLEFDTRVALVLIESLIVDGKILQPFPDGGSFSFCNSENICSKNPDYSFGEHISSFSSNYTSGLIVILPILLISKIINFFVEVPQSVGYLIFLYSLSMAMITSFSILLINFSSNFSLEKKFVFWILPIPILCSLYLYTIGTIVGEYIASILLSLSIFALLLSFNTKQKSKFYCIIAFILGASFEAKSSVGIIILVSLFFLFYQSWAKERSLIRIITYGFFAILPKLLFYIYVWSTVNFSIQGFINHLDAYGRVAKYNANAFLNWQVPDLYGNSLFFYGNLERYLIIIVLLILIFLLYCIVNKKYSNIALPFFSTIALLSALVYPTIFSAPYPRIFSPFWALVPTCSIALILLFKDHTFKDKNIIWKNIPLILIIYFCIEFFGDVEPLPNNITLNSVKSWNFNEIKNFNSVGDDENIDINGIDRNFEKAYPSIIIDDTKNFLIYDFFSMPWDFYLGRRLKKESMVKILSVIEKVPANNFESDTFFIYSCRWGHCNRENEFNSYLHFNNGGRKIKCKFIKPVDSKVNNIRLYSCK